jgi:uncharacterized protein (TIGR00251 family)
MSRHSQILEVRARPNSRTSALHQEADGTWRAELRSPPVDGKANAELIELVAKHFGVRKAAVSIKTGAAGRTKLVRIEAD